MSIKIIIAGSRSIRSYVDVMLAMNEALHKWGLPDVEPRALPFLISEVVSGGARGVDELGERWATTRFIPVKRFPADWKSYGNRAGPIRNRAMAEYVFEHSSPYNMGGLVAVWDGRSRGTADMIQTAQELGLRVHVKRPIDLELPPGWNDGRP